MSEQSKNGDGLADTGKPDDPAKRENPDTRIDQQQPYHQPDNEEAGQGADPALETTRKAGQGAG